MKQIGKYEILQEIGKGGFGLVFKGRDPLIKRLVAIKTCISDDEKFRARFYREAEIAGRLDHPAITTVHDFGTEGETPYLVQEYLSGEDLHQIIRRGDQVPPQRKVEYLLEIARALEYAHSQGVIHRDIKPSNIRILEDQRVKVMDFGIAKLTHATTQLTQGGMTLGTAAYLPPEMLKGAEVGPTGDIFSFGVLAYELLTYRLPFIADNVSALLHKILYKHPPPIAESWPQCPADDAAIVSKCLRKDPRKRFSSFGEVVSALESLADMGRRGMPTGDATEPSPDAGRQTLLRRTGKSSPLRWAAAALAAAVVGVGVSWLATGGRHDAGPPPETEPGVDGSPAQHSTNQPARNDDAPTQNHAGSTPGRGTVASRQPRLEGPVRPRNTRAPGRRRPLASPCGDPSSIPCPVAAGGVHDALLPRQ